MEKMVRAEVAVMWSMGRAEAGDEQEEYCLRISLSKHSVTVFFRYNLLAGVHGVWDRSSKAGCKATSNGRRNEWLDSYIVYEVL